MPWVKSLIQRSVELGKQLAKTHVRLYGLARHFSITQITLISSAFVMNANINRICFICLG